MKIQRLLKMQSTELAFRGRQQASILFERLATPVCETTVTCRFAREQKPQAFSRLVGKLYTDQHEIACAGLLGRFTELAPTRFFPGACEAGMAGSITEHCGTMRARIIATADIVCAGRFPILGYGDLSFGDTVNWHLDAVSGQESPMRHWSRINPLAFDQVGDSKVVWELNRHQWLLHLGQAYRFTGDERYAEVFADLLRDWMRHNPPGIGVNWSSALEVALRLIAWCWALVLFRGSNALTPALFLDMLGWIQEHARFVSRNLSTYFSPNTHLTGEALGLFYAGTLLPELQGAAEWRKQGRAILLDQMQQQVYPDGVHFEHSTRYQYYTVEIYLHFVILADQANIDIGQEVRARLQQMVKFLLTIRQPDKSMPQIGDTDGGWLVPLVRRAPGDHRALFSTAALLFKSSQFAWAAGKLAPETLWLLGNSGLKEWQKRKPAPPTAESLHCFRNSGYVVIRNHWESTANQLLFVAGKLGSHGHGHADLLSIQCSAFGEQYLVDAGTYCYTADPQWRDYFRTTAAHNTVLVDGRSQVLPRGPFSWHKRPRAQLKTCVTKTGYTLLEASHDGYADLPDPVVHRRRIMFVEAKYWVVIDDLDGKAEHELDLRYQFAPLPVAGEADGWVRARGSASALLLKVFCTHPFSTDITRGGLDPAQGWVSPDYGQRIPAPQLVYRLRDHLPVRLVTVLYPVSDPAGPPPDITPLIEHKTFAGLGFNTGNKQKIAIFDDKVAIIRGIKTGVQALPA